MIRDDKESGLAWVKRQRENLWIAQQHFDNAVNLAKERGATVREIQEAAGYKSPASIQKILNKSR